MSLNNAEQASNNRHQLSPILPTGKIQLFKILKCHKFILIIIFIAKMTLKKKKNYTQVTPQ